MIYQLLLMIYLEVNMLLLMMHQNLISLYLLKMIFLYLLKVIFFGNQGMKLYKVNHLNGILFEHHYQFF